MVYTLAHEFSKLTQKIYIVKNPIFHDCSYTIYPTSALKATGQNTKAPRTQKQDSVKTSSNTGEVPPTDSSKPVKHKNK